MYSLLYFDTEDFFSPPEHPVHRLPGQLAEIMTRYGLPGCFHIHGEKARFMEQHGQTDVISAIRKHDVSLHYDRGSIHPTTAEEVSQLGWFEGVDRVFFRELPGFQAMERIFGTCTGLTQHGGTFGAQIVYAAGKLGKPFMYSPFRLPGRNVVWYCNNLLVGGYQADFYFDRYYRDTTKFEENLAKVDGYMAERARTHDFTAMFGCHPVITMMQEFPDAMNFNHGAMPPRAEWKAPELVENVSIPLILENFQRVVEKFLAQPNVEWTSLAGIAELYGQRPVRVSDEVVLRGAQAVMDNDGPTWTAELSAAELLYLLAIRVLWPADRYDVPQVMGPLGESVQGRCAWADVAIVASEVIAECRRSGYLPESCGGVSPEQALVLLARHAAGASAATALPEVTVDAIPGVAEATDVVQSYKAWRVHGESYYQPGIVRPFRRQCWTLKPAYTASEYADGGHGADVELGTYLTPMFGST